MGIFFSIVRFTAVGLLRPDVIFSWEMRAIQTNTAKVHREHVPHPSDTW